MDNGFYIYSASLLHVPMASLIRSVGGLTICFYQGLWLVDLNADVTDQSMNRCGHECFFLPFCMILYGFPYRFQRAWTVLWSTRHLLDVVRVGAWNSLIQCTEQLWHGQLSPESSEQAHHRGQSMGYLLWDQCLVFPSSHCRACAASDMGLSASVPLPIVMGIFVLLGFQSSWS